MFVFLPFFFFFFLLGSEHESYSNSCNLTIGSNCHIKALCSLHIISDYSPVSQKRVGLFQLLSIT